MCCCFVVVVVYGGGGFSDGDFMMPRSDNNQAGVIGAYNPTKRYLDDLLNIDNFYFVDNFS